MRIAISGKMGSGKTALAQHFINKYGFVPLSFAKAVKDTTMEVFGLTREEAYGKKKDRVLLQLLGQKIREINPDVWVNKVIRDMSIDNKYVAEHFVIDDVRYKNEFETLKKNGFIMVRVNADEEIRRERLGEKFLNPTHISETDLDEHEQSCWDVLFWNNENNLNHLYMFGDMIYKEFNNKDNV